MVYLAAMIAVIPIYKLYNFDNGKIMFGGYDKFRRGCGRSIVDDPLATDYSYLLTEVSQFQSFCNYFKVLHPDTEYNCEDLNTNVIRAEQLKENSRLFFKTIRPVDAIQENYSYGYAIDYDVICLDSEIPEEKDFESLCSSEFNQFYNIATGNTLTDKYLLTSDQLNDVTSELAKKNASYLLNFCMEKPGEGRFYQQEVQKALGLKYYVFQRTQIQNDTFVDYVQYLGAQLGGIFMEQLRENWTYIIYGVLASIVISIIYFIFLRFFVSIIVWATLIGILAASIYGSVTLITMGEEIAKTLQYKLDYFGIIDEDLSEKENLYKGFGYALLVIAILVFLIFICCFTTIRIATGVIRQTMVAIQAIPGIFFIPLVGVVVIIIWMAYVLIFGYSIYLKGTFDSKLNQYDFVNIDYDDRNNLVKTYDIEQCVIFALFVFGAIWGIFFIYGFNEFWIQSSIVQWYFTLDRTRKGLKGTFKRSFIATIKSTGTIFVTSFITSLVFFLRVVFEYVLKRLEQSNRVSNSKSVKIAICFTRCILKLIQKIVQWVNRNIQAYAAISGEGYCKSMKLSVRLLLSRLLTNLFAKTLTQIFLGLGQVLVIAAGIVTVLALGWMKNETILWACVILSAAIGIVLSFYIFEIVRVAVDTIYFSFLYEETYLMRQRELNGVIYAPGELKSLLK